MTYEDIVRDRRLMTDALMKHGVPNELISAIIDLNTEAYKTGHYDGREAMREIYADTDDNTEK